MTGPIATSQALPADLNVLAGLDSSRDSNLRNSCENGELNTLLREQMDFDRDCQEIKRLISEGRYERAVMLGEKTRSGATCSADTGYAPVLAWAEFDLNYARALIYAICKLNIITYVCAHRYRQEIEI